MNTVLTDYEIPMDSGVTIEMQIPQTLKWIDFIITGKNESNRDHAAIVELKQWETEEKTGLDGIVKTFIGGGKRDVSHPSYQALSYVLLIDFYEAVYDGDIHLKACAFLHNYYSNGVLDDPLYKDHTEKAPIFMKKDIKKLREYIKSFIKHGDSDNTIYWIENGRIRPSKMLADCLSSILKGNEEFISKD